MTYATSIKGKYLAPIRIETHRLGHDAPVQEVFARLSSVG